MMLNDTGEDLQLRTFSLRLQILVTHSNIILFGQI